MNVDAIEDRETLALCPRTLIAVGAGHELELRLFHQEPAHVSYYTWYNNESLNKSAGMLSEARP